MSWLAAIRRPVTLAKTLATMDVLSGGRLDIGVGVGWQQAEYEAAGLPFETRGKLLDHSLEVVSTLWREGGASFSSPQLSFDMIHQSPKPVQPGGVPFWISGTLNDAVMRRIVKYGSGWIPWGDDGMNPLEGIKRIKDALAKAGRNPEGFETTSYIPIAYGADKKIDLAKTMSVVPAMVAGGLTDLRVTLDLPKSQAAVEDLLTPLVQAFRQAAGRR